MGNIFGAEGGRVKRMRFKNGGFPLPPELDPPPLSGVGLTGAGAPPPPPPRPSAWRRRAARFAAACHSAARPARALFTIGLRTPSHTA